MDYEMARANMIEQQIRPWNVLATQTLEALNKIRREDFVPHQYRHLAFADVQIPLGDSEVMLEPKVSARMVESLQLNLDDRVLEIGSGSGYVTALLAVLSAHVSTVEINPQLCAQAQRNLDNMGLTNITLENGDAHAGWGAPGQFDAILINGSVPHIIDSDTATSPWATALAADGRLVGIEGHLPIMHVVRLYKTNQDGIPSLHQKSLFETTAPRLHNIQEHAQFKF